MSKKPAKKIKRKNFTKPGVEPHKPMPKKTKILIIAIICALAVAALLFGLLYDDGSLKIKDEAIVGAEEGWLILNRGKDSARNAKYYKLGEITSYVEGFTRDADEKVTSAKYATDFFCYPDAEDSNLKYYYITGVNKKAEDIVKSVSESYMAYGNEGELTEPAIRNTPSGDLHYFIFTGTSVGEDAPIPAQSLISYLPAKDGTCVLISVVANPKDTNDYRTAEELLVLAERIAATITLEE